MAKLLLVLFCCFIWVGAHPFFFNFQNSYASQPIQSTSRPAASQSSNIGAGGIFTKWLIGPQILTYKFFGLPTQRPRPTQRPVIQIDPVYVPVDLDKEYASTTSTEVPAEEIGSTKKSTTSTTTTSSYEYSSTKRTTTPFSFTESSSSSTQRTTTPFSFTDSSSSFSTSESTTEAETIKPTTYRPITTSSSTQRSTTTTSTTEKTETEIGYEIDSTEDKQTDIKEPSTSTTSTTTEEYNEVVDTTTATPSLPLTYLPPIMKNRRLSPPASLGLSSTGTISSGVSSVDPLTTGTISSGVSSVDPLTTGLIFSRATNDSASVAVAATSSDASSTSGSARPFDIISFRGTIADDITGEGLIPESRSTEDDIESNGIDPRVFFYY